MGLDNGIWVKSNHRKITREMLPTELEYPFNFNDTEILYWRKNWGLRNDVVHTFESSVDSEFIYLIETPQQVFELVQWRQPHQHRNDKDGNRSLHTNPLFHLRKWTHNQDGDIDLR